MAGDCPRCNEPLYSPNSCRCGWRARVRQERHTAEAPAYVACAHEGCRESALCRIRTATGWANLCMPHYEQHYARIGDAATAAHGLDKHQDETRAEWKKRVFAHWKTLAKRAAARHRPFNEITGEIEEEAA
jgi:hypothetical protein